MAGCAKCRDQGMVRLDWYPIPVWVACPDCGQDKKDVKAA